jgi:hypothetical protein
MRVLPVAALSLFALTGAGNATVADFTKYYYFDYSFYSGQFNIFIDTNSAWPDRTIWFHELDESAPLQTWPMFEFGFFLTSRNVDDVVRSPFTFATGGDGSVEAQRGMDGIYFYRPGHYNDEDYYAEGEGSLSFDRDLNIVSWDVFGWGCFGCNADWASSSPEPLGPLWEELLGWTDDRGWIFPTGTDLPQGGFYSSNYWEPFEFMYSTAIGRWEKRESVVCWSDVLDDEIACPEEPARPTPVPLPASLPLLAGGLILLAGARRLRQPL